MLSKLILLMILASNILLAKVVITSKYEYYEVYPKDALSIEESILEVTPLRNNQAPIQGAVDWYIRYDYKTNTQNEECQINDVVVNLVVIYKLPRIDKSYKVSKQTQREFNRHKEVLRYNLGRFKKLALTCAKKIENELYAIQEKKTCHIINKNAYFKSKALIATFKEYHKDLAQKTFNGYAENFY